MTFPRTFVKIRGNVILFVCVSSYNKTVTIGKFNRKGEEKTMKKRNLEKTSSIGACADTIFKLW